MIYSNQTIEELLQGFHNSLGKEYSKYRNHVYRVFLACLILDEDPRNEVKYAIAAAFHDIGIWTDHTIDYLDPSITQAKLYLLKIGKEDWVDEVSHMIYWHHKVKKYTGKYQLTVETFRKADWIDVTLGFRTFGLDMKNIRQNRKSFPNLGFHRFLVRKVSGNFLAHPLKPLPMFKN